jgi:hypothetical protein
MYRILNPVFVPWRCFLLRSALLTAYVTINLSNVADQDRWTRQSTLSLTSCSGVYPRVQEERPGFQPVYRQLRGAAKTSIGDGWVRYRVFILFFRWNDSLTTYKLCICRHPHPPPTPDSCRAQSNIFYRVQWHTIRLHTSKWGWRKLLSACWSPGDLALAVLLPGIELANLTRLRLQLYTRGI